MSRYDLLWYEPNKVVIPVPDNVPVITALPEHVIEPVVRAPVVVSPSPDTIPEEQVISPEPLTLNPVEDIVQLDEPIVEIKPPNNYTWPLADNEVQPIPLLKLLNDKSGVEKLNCF